MERGANWPFAHSQKVRRWVTHPAHKLKVTISLGDQLSIEGPGERNIKDGVTGDLAG